MLKICESRAIGIFCLECMFIPYNPLIINISWCYFSIQHIVQRGWRVVIPNQYVLMLFPRCGVGFCFLMKISWCYLSIQHILFRGGDRFWFLMNISWCFSLFNIFFRCLTQQKRCPSWRSGLDGACQSIGSRRAGMVMEKTGAGLGCWTSKAIAGHPMAVKFQPVRRSMISSLNCQCPTPLFTNEITIWVG